MAIERRETSGDTPRIGWWWGVFLLAAVLWLLGGNLISPVAIMTAAVLIAWAGFIVILHLGRQRAWWR
jgi:hypothetical protein